MKKLALMVAICVLGWTNSAVSAETQVDIYIWAVAGPVRGNTNAFEEFSTNLVREIYLKGGPTNDLGHRVTADLVSQPTSLLSNTVWFAIKAVGRNGGTFYPSQLMFEGNSSDTNNYLKSRSSLSAPNTTYTPRLLGVVYGAGGPRSNDVLYASTPSNLSDIPVNECIFIGAQATYFTYGNNAQRGAIQDFITSFNNWTLSGSWSLTNGTSVLGRATRTLETTRAPAQPVLSVSSVSNQVTVGVNMEIYNSAILYSTEGLQNGPTGWNIERTINAGDTIPQTSGAQKKFFKAVLQ